MIEKTRHSHTNFLMIQPYVRRAEKHGAIRCKSEGFMDLTVEYLETNDCYGNPMYSITHYGEQNGDAMRDPDMMFSVNYSTGTVIPWTFRNDYVGVNQEIMFEMEGKKYYRVSLLKQLDDFLWMWLKNIKDQGFSPDVFEII